MTILLPTPVDRSELAYLLKKGVVDDDIHPQSYEDCIVLKPWGNEFQMFDDKKHTLWALTLQSRRATSLHCHQHKTATFIPLTGPITLILFDRQYTIGPGEQITADKGVFHSLWNNSEDAVTLLEIETPSIKMDLVRASDAWGRNGKAYEGERHIVREDLHRYGYGRVTEDQPLVRFGHEISVGDDGFHIRKLQHA